MILGVRAASRMGMESLPSHARVATSLELSRNGNLHGELLNPIGHPVHLSIDLDVLSPGTVQNPRSVEPGGLSWYELLDAVDTVFEGPGVSSVALVGCGPVSARSPAAVLSAQLVIRLASLVSRRAK